MSKKPVAVSLRKPQAPADVDSFVGRDTTPTQRATPKSPLESATDVLHGTRHYREMTFHLPTEVARQLSFYCLDRNCDANRVVAEAVSKHVNGVASQTPSIAAAAWVERLETLAGQLRGKLGALWALRR